MEVLQKLSVEELQSIEKQLESAACSDRREELSVVRALMCRVDDRKEKRRYEKKVLHILKKFTHKKYQKQWEAEVQCLQELLEKDGEDLDTLRRGLSELVDLAHRRFEG
jgi:uncharacterized protein YxjI